MFSVYENGACFSPDVLDITSEDILARFVEVSKQDQLSSVHNWWACQRQSTILVAEAHVQCKLNDSSLCQRNFACQTTY